MINIQGYNSTSTQYQLHKKIYDKISFSDDTISRGREESFIKDISNRVKQSKSVLYTLELDNQIVGLVSVSAMSIKEQPSLQIDYIFVSNEYRGKVLDELDRLKPFRFLIEFVINLAKDIKKQIGLNYLILSPDNDELKSKYKNLNFLPLSDDWMYKKI